MDLSKLSTGDKVMGGSAIALLIFSFFTWFSAGSGQYTLTQNGWDYFFTGILPVLIGLAILAYVLAVKAAEAVTIPDLPVEHPVVILGFGAFAGLLLILRLLMGGEYGGYSGDLLKRSFGLYLSVLAGIGLAVGAFLSFKESGASLPTKGGGTGGGTTPPGGTPPTPF